MGMKIESEMATLSSDLDEMTAEAGLSEEKAQRAMIDAARLADELRAEQDAAQGLERERKLLDAQVKDMQSRVDEAQTQALKGGKKAMTKMDTRIRELESELDAENRRMADAQKNLRKSERKIKELSYQQDEDREPREDAGPDRPAAGQDQVLQEADRGGGGDRRPQPGQVQAGPEQRGRRRGPRSELRTGTR